MSALDAVSLLGQHLADAVAQIALQLDRPIVDGAPGAAGFLELRAELLEERGIARQVVDDGNGLAPAPFLLHSELGNDAVWNRFRGGGAGAALAVALRPAAARADAADPRRIHQPPLPLIAHDAIFARPQPNPTRPTAPCAHRPPAPPALPALPALRLGVPAPRTLT